MPKSEALAGMASALSGIITDLVFAGGDIKLHQAVEGYQVLRLSANDGTDYEEVIIDTRGREAGNVGVSRRTVNRPPEKDGSKE